MERLTWTFRFLFENVYSDRRLHHGRCPRLLAALEYAEQQQQQQPQQQQVASNGNGGSVTDFVMVTPSVQPTVAISTPTTGGNSVGGSGNLSVAPRASPEASEAEASANTCRRLSAHRASSVSYNGSENIVVGNPIEASILTHIYAKTRYTIPCALKLNDANEVVE